MFSIARIRDKTSHGGEILEGSLKTLADGEFVARIGDKVSCPIHGDNVIVESSTVMFIENKGVARLGDSTDCGSTIITGSETTFTV